MYERKFVQFEYLEINPGKQVSTVFTGFSKAFDKVSHQIPIKKLDSIAFSPSTMCLFESYLSNHPLFVQFKGYKSKAFHLRSCIPQGSNLQQYLLLIFINDLEKVVNYSQCRFFADDVKIYRPIITLQDFFVLQKDWTHWLTGVK